ncbi:hypothetical protein [Corallococcus carmarthensis]|uniref:Uncharacterized protein n=1 Tax=Corallococcus carmarthensis TaxID=2316728 RepID=A0A3A8JHS8_9BACT|nr:hypothetical protein [Corallococcus carmarthensis]NOK23195.1 hypothetical protein [Corallococcus carmarthensis]RKG94546.1 hypothetical protein D7X32_41850 [Corallococcus carmarthensis]
MPGHATIQVLFIDAETNRPLGEVKLPVENLPASFEAATQLELGGRSYEVVSATPRTVGEFQAMGTLRLALREVKVTLVDPGSILYSLPTIEGVLPAIAEGSTKQGRRMLEFHEDDWRQVEFVALTLQVPIQAELKSIQQIHSGHRKAAGFDALHLRGGVPSPLEGVRLTLADLRGALGETAAWQDGLSFQGVAGLIAGGFAVQMSPALWLYGTEREGHVTALGLQQTGTRADLEGVGRMLAALASRYQLGLVDWCRAAQVPTSPQHVHDWLTGRS